MVGVDDGAKDIDEAKEMIRLAKEEGIKEIIVTPHYTLELKRVYETKFEELQKLACREGIILHKGCEYKLQDAVVQKGELITLADSEFVLVEVTQTFLTEYVLNQIYDLKLCGYEIIIAHPERSFKGKDIEKLKKLGEMNVYFQLTAGSFLGMFGKQAQKLSQELLEIGLCHFVASDAHNSKSRSFCFKETRKYLKTIYTEEGNIDLLFENNPKAVFSKNEKVVTKHFKKRNFFERLFKK
jgi:protein-tyrosine phosphatase